MQVENDKHSVQSLKQAIKEEIFQPQIQMYKKDLINHFIRKVNIQEHKLEEKNQQVSQMEKDIIMYELDRIKYYLKRYFRIRNRKIEKNIFYILKNDMNNFFSVAEFQYAVNYYNLLLKQFENSFFDNVPNKYGKKLFLQRIVDQKQDNQQTQIVQEPDEDKHVMIQFEKDLENFQLSREQNVKVLKGEVAMVRQKFIQELIEKKKVKLI